MSMQRVYNMEVSQPVFLKRSLGNSNQRLIYYHLVLGACSPDHHCFHDKYGQLLLRPSLHAAAF